MKLLICADLHLSKFKYGKFLYLQELFSQYDQIVIVGDFWDSWFTTFDKFINSRWNELFPLLKSKRCIFIYGNHDPRSACDKRTELFSIHADERYSGVFEGKKITFTHGDIFRNESEALHIRMYKHLLRKAERINVVKYPLYNFLALIELLIFRLKPADLFRSKISRAMNRFIKKERYKLFKDGFLICGDTHYAELDLGAQYANPGPILHGHSYYLTLIDGEFKLHKERYREHCQPALFPLTYRDKLNS